MAVMVKAVLYGATLGAAGGVGFLSYSRSLLERADRIAIGRLIMILIAASAVMSAVRILVTAGSMTGDASGLLDPGLVSMVWHGGEGRALLIRVAGLLLAMPAMVRPGAVAAAVAPVGAAAAATSFAWVGHAHGTESDWPILLVGVHLLAAAFWLGAFAPLLMLARRQEPRRFGAAAERFGAAAVGGVAVLVLAGVTLLWVLLGGLSELWNSSYGITACVKLALVACLLACAAFNKLRLTPRVLDGDARAARSLRNSIAIEMAVAALILIVTAALTTLTGPPSPE
jgi:copper resistance protein D